MAWASKKQYAICMESEEGKDLIEKLPKLSQDEFQVEFGKLLGKTGASYDKNEDEDYKEDKDDDLPWWDKPDEDEVREAYGDDFEPTRDNIINKQRETEDAFNMSEDEGWELSDSGEKSFIKNKGKDNEMFIQYNGQDYDGSNQEYVAGYMKDGDYISEKFDNLEDAKSFLENQDNDEEPTTKFAESNYKKSEVKDYSSIKNEKKKLDTIVGDVSHYTDDKGYDVLSFRETLEKNGFDVDYIENKSGTWQDHNGEKFKEYDIKLKNGTHIYFRLIADKDYDTKEVIAYTNGKGW